MSIASMPRRVDDPLQRCGSMTRRDKFPRRGSSELARAARAREPVVTDAVGSGHRLVSGEPSAASTTALRARCPCGLCCQAAPHFLAQLLFIEQPGSEEATGGVATAPSTRWTKRFAARTPARSTNDHLADERMAVHVARTVDSLYHRRRPQERALVGPVDFPDEHQNCRFSGDCPRLTTVVRHALPLDEKEAFVFPIPSMESLGIFGWPTRGPLRRVATTLGAIGKRSDYRDEGFGESSVWRTCLVIARAAGRNPRVGDLVEVGAAASKPSRCQRYRLSSACSAISAM